MSDERERLARTYRDLPGGDLLDLYQKHEDLSEAAMGALRDELKLRGIDPDSLKATVPKARSDEPGEEGGGDATLAEAGDEVPEELRGEGFDPAAGMVTCLNCGAPNLPEEENCRACRTAMHEPRQPTMSRQLPGTAGPEPGTVASAAFGLVGVSGILFAAYIGASGTRATSFAAAVGAIGVVALGVSLALYARSRPKDA